MLTLGQNILLGQKLSEYHTGYRAYNSEVLRSINFMANDDGFVFDNQLLAQVIYKGYTIGEISCPAKYFPDASSIGFTDSMQYGLGVMRTSVMYCFNKWGMVGPKSSAESFSKMEEIPNQTLSRNISACCVSLLTENYSISD